MAKKLSPQNFWSCSPKSCVRDLSRAGATWGRRRWPQGGAGRAGGWIASGPPPTNPSVEDEYSEAWYGCTWRSPLPSAAQSARRLQRTVGGDGKSISKRQQRHLILRPNFRSAPQPHHTEIFKQGKR